MAYSILGLLPDPEGGLSDITGLYLDKFSLLPASQRIFIQTVPQIKGWRDLPQTISDRIPAQQAKRPQKPAQILRFPAHLLAVPALVAPCPPLYPLYTPSKPLVIPLYFNRGGLLGDYWGISGGYADGLGLSAGGPACTE